MRLSINICTRNRPDLIGKTIEDTLRNIELPGTCLMVSVDEDDEKTRDVAMKYLSHCAVSVLPREDTLGEKYNRVMKVSPADVYMNMVDYAPAVVKGFDRIVMEAASVYPDGICAVEGPLANLTFPCFQAVTHKLAEKMGGVFPPYFPYWFVDHWLMDIYRMIDRSVTVSAYTDFWSRRPEKTLELRDVDFWATFYDQTYPLRRDIALSIINSPEFDETPARKRALPMNFAKFKQHSEMINDHCRQGHADMARSRGGSPPDARYLRVKENAARVLLGLTSQQKAA